MNETSPSSNQTQSHIRQPRKSKKSEVLNALTYASKLGTHNAIHREFQSKSRASLHAGISGNTSGFNKLQHESKEVRSKSMSMAQLPTDPHDLTVRIGTQAI